MLSSVSPAYAAEDKLAVELPQLFPAALLKFAAPFWYLVFRDKLAVDYLGSQSREALLRPEQQRPPVADLPWHS